MPNDEKPEVPAGWIGGFAESNKAFAYPNPELSSLPMLDNMANIDLLDRQQQVLWPEFSWETEPGDSDPKRCYQMFAPDISRLGYTDEGRVYSIICPQQGIDSPSFGSINVEVTVTGQRGWVDENNRELAAGMSVVGKIWFGPGFHEKPAVKLLWKLLEELGHDLPISKEKAIVVTTHDPGKPDQVIFPLKKGESTGFGVPAFARHADEAWSVGNLEVEIGPITPTPHAAVNDFNQLFMDIFNLSTGNMLKAGNVLTWNVWFNHPQLVDRKEWAEHAEKWRKSIDADHGSPDGQRTPARFYDGAPFNAIEELVEEEISKIYHYIRKHLSPRQRLLGVWKTVARKLHLPKIFGG